ncbi:MAG: response regulator [Candidatus Omnitrophica bacterium]|nr:response regulator [Candidatus Omnitrophota bacterium]
MPGKKVVIFDDEIDMLTVTETILTSRGFDVITFSSSKDAIKDIKREKPDLILLDINMPHKDGYQVCDEVRCDEEIKHIPIIVFTAQTIEKDLIDKAHAFYGADDYVIKPFEANDLVDKINKNILKHS